MQLTEQHINLFTKAISNEVSSEELAELNALTTENSELENEYIKFQEIWNLSSGARESNVNHEWEVFKTKAGINKDTNETPVIPISTATANTSSPFNFLRIAAAILVLFGAFGLWRTFENGNGLELYAEDKVVHDTLYDGSFIAMNPKSVLIVEDDFGKTDRRVSLNGMANFTVKRDESKPFIINTGDVDVQVLGTSFLVNAYKSENLVEVIVSSGKVSVKNTSGPALKEVTLVKGEKAIFNKTTGEMIKSQNVDNNFLSWVNGEFEFHNEPLSGAVSALNRYFDSKIKLSGKEISNCKLTATFDGNSLEQVIHVIQTTLALEVKQEGQKYILSGVGCPGGQP